MDNFLNFTPYDQRTSPARNLGGSFTVNYPINQRDNITKINAYNNIYHLIRALNQNPFPPPTTNKNTHHQFQQVTTLVQEMNQAILSAASGPKYVCKPQPNLVPRLFTPPGFLPERRPWLKLVTWVPQINFSQGGSGGHK